MRIGIKDPEGNTVLGSLQFVWLYCICFLLRFLLNATVSDVAPLQCYSRVSRVVRVPRAATCAAGQNVQARLEATRLVVRAANLPPKPAQREDSFVDPTGKVSLA